MLECTASNLWVHALAYCLLPFSWTCSACTVENVDPEAACQVCGRIRSVSEQEEFIQNMPFLTCLLLRLQRSAWKMHPAQPVLLHGMNLLARFSRICRFSPDRSVSLSLRAVHRRFGLVDPLKAVFKPVFALFFWCAHTYLYGVQVV